MWDIFSISEIGDKLQNKTMQSQIRENTWSGYDIAQLLYSCFLVGFWFRDKQINSVQQTDKV